MNMDDEVGYINLNEPQSEELKFANKYRGMAYLLQVLLKDGDITSSEYSDALVEMKKMKEEERKKRFPDIKK